MAKTKASRVATEHAVFPEDKAGAHDHGHSHGEGEDCCHGPHLICEMHLRLFKAEDYKGLAATWKASGIETDETDSASAISKNLSENKNSFRIFVGEACLLDADSEKPVSKPTIAGGVILTHDGRRAHVYHLAVHPEFRGGGLGKALLEQCEGQAKMWGFNHLRMSVRANSGNPAAYKLCQSKGWSPIREYSVFEKTLAVAKKAKRAKA
jgi:ribosomal protein S18 acetylase RimI-like enzyme